MGIVMSICKYALPLKDNTGKSFRVCTINGEKSHDHTTIELGTDEYYCGRCECYDNDECKDKKEK